jgi:hypothetical protein
MRIGIILGESGAPDPLEAAVREQLAAFRAAGATDFVASELGSGEERARTRALLAGWVAAAV